MDSTKPPVFAVLVCGGRDYDKEMFLRMALNALGEAIAIQEVIQGEAPGADSMARDWAMESWYNVASFPADWARYGRGAGPKRNAQMLEYMLSTGLKPLVVAFGGGRGTDNMVKQASAVGVPVIRHLQ